MKILNLLKKEKDTDIKHKKDVVVKSEKKAKPVIKKAAKVAKKAVATTSKTKKRVIGTANISYRILKQPHISEKASLLSKNNQYTFRVSQDANKKEIRDSVEQVYGVDVLSVNVIKIPKKSRRVGKVSGWRKGYKKAIVKIKQGQKIDILPR